MTLHLYNFDGTELGFTDKIISSYREAVWNGIGTSEFHIENNDPLVYIITKNKFLFLEDDNNFQDIIIGYEYGDDFTVYCRSLSWLLTKMIIPPTSYSGKTSACATHLLSVSKGCDIHPGEIPEITEKYSFKSDEVTVFSDGLKECLDQSYSGHQVRFSHSDNKFYLDILTGNHLNFYVSENDCTLDSLTLNRDILDLSNSTVFKKRIKYMGKWNPSRNSPAIYDESDGNYATYYEVTLGAEEYSHFDITWKNGDYIYCNTTNGKWKKSETPPEDFYVYLPDSSADDMYRWYHISHKENKEEALTDLSAFKENKDFSARSRNLVFLKDYKLGDFIRLQYTLNNKTITVPCQFSEITINSDNIDNTENPTLKEVK